MAKCKAVILFAIVFLTCTIATVQAGTFTAESISQKSRLSEAQIRKVCVQKTLAGAEYCVIDDMLFPISDLQAFGGFGGGRWPGGILVYAIDASVSAAQHRVLLQACDMWAAGADVQCKLRTTESVYITVYSGDANYSRIGYGKGPLVVFNWNYVGIVAHELAHAFGMLHEQSRSDRDSFVVINFPNIQEGQEHNFARIDSSANYTPYDYSSVMHYDPCAFSRNKQCVYVPDDPNEPAQRKTIVPVLCHTDAEASMGNRAALTAYDLQSMAARYEAAIPLKLFEDKRAAECGIEHLDKTAKSAYCDVKGAPCALAGPKVLSATEVRKDKWCDNGFMTRESCRASKEMTYSNTRQGARCGVLQINHVQHREYRCSCVDYPVAASCRSGRNGIKETLLADYLSSKDPTRKAIGTFVASIRRGIASELLSAQVGHQTEKLLILGYPSQSYVPKLRRAAVRLESALSALAKMKAEKKTAQPLTYEDVKRMVR